MAYQEVTTTGYGGRLKNAFKGIAGGFIMFIIGTVLLFLNEGNYVKTKKALEEAQGVLVPVSNVSAVDPAFSGKLIHASAFADTQDVLTDGMFGFNEKAIAVIRKVEYYQNEESSHTETKNKRGGEQEERTVYTYEPKWGSAPVDSGKFKNPQYKGSNFVLLKIEKKIEYAKNVSFGGYKLPPFIITSIEGDISADVKLTDQQRRLFESQITQSMAARGLRSSGKMVHVEGNVAYFGASTDNPAIGDVRVTLTKRMPADISIIAKVIGSTFEKFIASNGKEVSGVAMGTVSSETMFAKQHSANSMLSWILRLIGVILVIAGLKAMFGILPALFNVLPFLSDIVGMGVGLICGVVGFAWSLLIISISWLFYRPLIGIPLLALAIGGIVYLKMKAKQKKEVQAA